MEIHQPWLVWQMVPSLVDARLQGNWECLMQHLSLLRTHCPYVPPDYQLFPETIQKHFWNECRTKKSSGHNPLRSNLHRWTKSSSWFCKGGHNPHRSSFHFFLFLFFPSSCSNVGQYWYDLTNHLLIMIEVMVFYTLSPTNEFYICAVR